MRAAKLTMLLAALALGGCLRTAFNRCTEEPPHPECAFLDAGVDTGPRADAPVSDAGPLDAPVAADAPDPLDAPLSTDAPDPLDAALASDAPDPLDARAAIDAPELPDAP